MQYSFTYSEGGQSSLHTPLPLPLQPLDPVLAPAPSANAVLQNEKEDKAIITVITITNPIVQNLLIVFLLIRTPNF